jgi:hypothetical protein
MRILLIAAILFSLASICDAEPSPSVRYLMNEPVTLFDWGIIRLYEYLDEYTAHYLKTNSVRDIYSTVSYDASRNSIIISLIVTRQAEQGKEDPSSVRAHCREICVSITQTLRREFLTDRDRHVRRSSGIYRFFGHIGFRGKQEPVDCFDEIEKITVIGVSVYSDKDPGRLISHSESPLMGKEILYVEGK